jgi:hypothetical protein
MRNRFSIVTLINVTRYAKQRNVMISSWRCGVWVERGSSSLADKTKARDDITSSRALIGW